MEKRNILMTCLWICSDTSSQIQADDFVISFKNRICIQKGIENEFIYPTENQLVDESFADILTAFANEHSVVYCQVRGFPKRIQDIASAIFPFVNTDSFFINSDIKLTLSNQTCGSHMRLMLLYLRDSKYSLIRLQDFIDVIIYFAFSRAYSILKNNTSSILQSGFTSTELDQLLAIINLLRYFTIAFNLIYLLYPIAYFCNEQSTLARFFLPYHMQSKRYI